MKLKIFNNGPDDLSYCVLGWVRESVHHTIYENGICWYDDCFTIYVFNVGFVFYKTKKTYRSHRLGRKK